MTTATKKRKQVKPDEPEKDLGIRGLVAPSGVKRFPSEVTAVETPKGQISSVGINEIQAYLMSQGCPPMRDDWDWSWKVGGKGEYVGTLPKRISKYLHQHGMKLPPNGLTAIGNIANQYTVKQSHYYLSFAEQMAWQRGAFADPNSCFYTCRNNARQLMKDNEFILVNIWTDSYDEKWHTIQDKTPIYRPRMPLVSGIGRAILVPITDGWVIFNAYGDLTACNYGALLASYWGETYGQTWITNENSLESLLWINNGRGYAVGSPAVVKRMRNKNSNPFELSYSTKDYYCRDCGSGEFPVRYTDRGGRDGNYCENCCRFTTEERLQIYGDRNGYERR